MKISEVSKKFNIPPYTLRYWEDIGVIPPVNKDSQGYRNYDDYDIDRIKFAILMRRAGVSVNYLTKYVILLRKGHKTAQLRKSLLKDQFRIISERIKKLTQSKDFLHWKITHFHQIEHNYHQELNERNVKYRK